MFERNLADLREGYMGDDGTPLHTGQVPVSTVFGSEYLHAKRATKLSALLGVMVSEGAVATDDPWAMMDKLVDTYLGQRQANRRR